MKFDIHKNLSSKEKINFTPFLRTLQKGRQIILSKGRQILFLGSKTKSRKFQIFFSDSRDPGTPIDFIDFEGMER